MMPIVKGAKNSVIIHGNRRCVIASIIIDGYNLIGIHHKDLESQRQRLVERLAEYKKLRDTISPLFLTGGRAEAVMSPIQ